MNPDDTSTPTPVDTGVATVTPSPSATPTVEPTPVDSPSPSGATLSDVSAAVGRLDDHVVVYGTAFLVVGMVLLLVLGVAFIRGMRR